MEANDNIHLLLKKYWGFDQFRSLQEDIIQSVLSGKDTLALLPTGGGKSICFQVPALTLEGICIVVSPLIALMKDQVQNLKQRGIDAIAIYSGMGFREMNYSLDNCIHGNVQFLYLSPERLKSELVLERLKQMKVSLIAVDEAHCISQWGYDFRPEYLQIGEFRKYFPKVPVIALTASATKQVVDDIQAKLLFQSASVFVKSFTRNNLAYVVNQSENKLDRILTILQKVKGSGLIYVRNRKKTQEIAKWLVAHNVNADFYHAGLSHALRIQRQDDWIHNKIRIMVCTNAFGMGIDKPDVRLVIHYEIPESLESYYQEAGRAGRDEQKAYAVLLSHKGDNEEALKKWEATFPAEEDIRRVYQGLCNYYQLPVGFSSERSYDFDLVFFCKTFNFKPALVFPALKILEQNELIHLSETFFEPSKLRILLGHGLLYKFQVEHPHYDDFLKLLLRTYGGIFDDHITINEKELSNKSNLALPIVQQMLTKLTQLGIVDYLPQKDTPQLTFMTNRVDAAGISFSKALLKQRKELAFQKVNAIIAYAENESVCRSKMIVSYFDELNSTDCGVCDICLLTKRLGLTGNDFELFMQQIKEVIAQMPQSIQALTQRLNRYPEDKIIETVRFLLDNDKLRYSDEQLLIWNEKEKK